MRNHKRNIYSLQYSSPVPNRVEQYRQRIMQQDVGEFSKNKLGWRLNQQRNIDFI